MVIVAVVSVQVWFSNDEVEIEPGIAFERQFEALSRGLEHARVLDEELPRFSEALRRQGGIYVRDYGAGNITTAAIRGAAAGHHERVRAGPVRAAPDPRGHRRRSAWYSLLEIPAKRSCHGRHR